MKFILLFLIAIFIPGIVISSVPSNLNYVLKAPPKIENDKKLYFYLNDLYTRWNILQVTTVDPNGNLLGDYGQQIIYYNGADYLSEVETTSPRGTAWRVTTAGGGSGSGTVTSGSIFQIPYYSATGNTLVGSTNFYNNNTNVGLGTSVAAEKFDVRGTVKTTGFQLDLNPNSSYVLQSNSVGVGTWVASTTLAVTSSGGGSGTVGIGTANWNAIYPANGNTVVASSVLQTVGNNIGIGSVTPGNVLDVNGFIRSTSLTGSQCVHTDSTGTLTSTGSDCSSGGSQWITGSIGIGTTSNVGIGTLNSNAALTVGNNRFQVTSIGNVTYSQFLNATAATNAIIQNTSTSSGSQTVIIGGTGDSSNLVLRGSGSVAQVDTNIKFNKGNSGSEGMRMNIDGNLGIASTAPGSVLDVQGTIRTTGLQLNLNPNASYILQSNSVGVGTWVPSTTLSVIATATPGGSSPQLQYNNTGAMGGISNFNSDGTNVGIGTTSYANSLGVLGNVGIGTMKYDAYLTQVTSGGNMVVQGNVGIGTWKATNSLIVMSNSAGNGGGNIGIGTLSPGVALDVNGTTRLSNSGDSYFGGNIGIGTTIPMNTLSVQGSLAVGSVTYTGTALGTNTAAFSGNVGIGSLSPGTQLDVAGTMRMIGTGAGSFRVQTGANTVCTTTCTTGKALFGLDDGTLGVALPHLVGPADATADECLCGS